MRIQRGDAVPKLLLNPHCPACEFRRQCHAQAVEQDSLSLLRVLRFGNIDPTAIRLIRRSHGDMRLVIAVLFMICQAAGQSNIAAPARTVQVRSYVRKDGTVFAARTRAAPGTGTAPRSTSARRAFQAQQPCPSTAARTGPCPGYVVDHVEPLACGEIEPRLKTSGSATIAN
jgi:hypothetical protein